MNFEQYISQLQELSIEEQYRFLKQKNPELVDFCFEQTLKEHNEELFGQWTVQDQDDVVQVSIELDLSDFHLQLAKSNQIIHAI